MDLHSIVQASQTMPLNTQPRETAVKADDGTIELVDVWNTFQGEGPFAGWPATFVRLAGCNLNCPLCDTNYTSARHRIKTTEAVQRIRSHGRRLVVVTGGEPFRQPLYELFYRLARSHDHIQVETNGTTPQDDWHDYPQNVTIVCSPKIAHLQSDWEDFIDAWKYVVQDGAVDPKDGLPLTVLGNRWSVARPPQYVEPSTIYIQPADEQDADKNARNLETAKRVCEEFGYRLCVQLHKIIGVP